MARRGVSAEFITLNTPTILRDNRISLRNTGYFSIQENWDYGYTLI